ncbi:MAG TPA: DUF4349 domain-containing protein [Gemmatimonadaceae bacterium]
MIPLLMLASCSRSPSEAHGGAVARATMKASSPRAAAAPDRAAPSVEIDQALASESSAGSDPVGTMLVRQGQASVEVKRLDDGVTALRQTAAQLGGFVANVTLSSGKDERHTGTLQVRVPSERFDALLAALSSLGRVESVASTVEDVGGEYVDLQARETNARHMEARLLEMLSGRTGKLSEVLSVEQELRRVREEIERYDARLKWLARRATLSSLDVTIHEPLPLIDPQRGPGPLAEAFAQAWERAVAVVAFCIAALGVLIPLGALVAAGVMVKRRMLRPGTPPGVTGV